MALRVVVTARRIRFDTGSVADARKGNFVCCSSQLLTAGTLVGRQQAVGWRLTHPRNYIAFCQDTGQSPVGRGRFARARP